VCFLLEDISDTSVTN